MIELIKTKAKRKDKFPGLGRPAETETDPLDAPDLDYFHYFDPATPARIDVVGNEIRDVYTAKNGVLSLQYTFGAMGNIALLNTGSINGMLAANTVDALDRSWGISPTIIPAGEFMYPSMTWFFVYRPTVAVNITGFLLSDYGNVNNKLIYLKVGNGAALEVSAFMRDGAGNSINATSGATVLSLDTDYLIVCKLDGANKRIDLWIDGVGSSFNDFNAAYDPTTTWEGKVTAQAVPTVGALSNYYTSPCSGDIGTMFLTKTALSNSDINLYANWIASNRSGTVWNNI